MSAVGSVVDVRGAEVRLRGVVHLYPSPEGDVVALRGVDLDVAAGEAVALLGPSGAGKSTVLGLIAGEIVPSAGTVEVGSVDVARLTREALSELRAKEISLVVQGGSNNLLPYATGAENVWFAQHGARRRGLPIEADAETLLMRFGLGELSSLRAEQMSSGQRQRLALLVGIASGPRLLLIDEPTAQLGRGARAEVIETIVRVHEALGATVVVVTHDPDVAARLERTVTIRDGRVGAEGRRGVEFAVVGHDGSIHLPADVLDLLPPESLVRVVRRDDVVELHRADEGPGT